MSKHVSLTHLAICFLIYGLVSSLQLEARDIAAYGDPKQLSGKEIGRIIIPAIGVNEVVREGAAQEIVDLGVAHWAGTAMFGELGNVVLAGHRTVKTRPFYLINQLDIGSNIVVQNNEGELFVYEVYEKFIVDVEDSSFIIDPLIFPETSIMTLFACHPLNSKDQRIVIRAVLEMTIGDEHDFSDLESCKSCHSL